MYFVVFSGVFLIQTSTFSSFLRSLKQKCLSKPGNPDFWSNVKKVGRDLSLISEGEAKKRGGLSSIADDEAEEVRSFVGSRRNGG
jgi:ATP-dependent DNA helicase 2 subunit 2